MIRFILIISIFFLFGCSSGSVKPTPIDQCIEPKEVITCELEEKEGMSTGKKVAIGVGIVAAASLVYVLFLKAWLAVVLPIL